MPGGGTYGSLQLWGRRPIPLSPGTHWPEAVITHRRMQPTCGLDEKQGRLIPSHLSKQKPMYGTAQPLSSGTLQLRRHLFSETSAATTAL